MKISVKLKSYSFSPTGTFNIVTIPDCKSAFVITLSLSRYAVPLSWIPRVCVFAGERRDVLYVDCAMTSPKLLFAI